MEYNSFSIDNIKILSKNVLKIKEDYFIHWKNEFKDFLPKKELTLSRYKKHLKFIVLIKIILENGIPSKNQKDHIIKLLELPSYYSQGYEITDKYDDMVKNVINTGILSDDHFEKDIFAPLYQNVIHKLNTSRINKGEFYTHSELAKVMINDSYKMGMKVVDPSSGSGTFLYELGKIIYNSTSNPLSEKNEAFENIMGFDLNPLACIMARANKLRMYLKYSPESIIKLENLNIYQFNSLFQEVPEEFMESFDLLIGNPPWLVINRIPDQEEKTRIKDLGNELGILIGGKLATTTEITTVFIYQTMTRFLKEYGTIFFVTPASLATGAQHSLFRQFNGLDSIEFWDFDKDLFRIHNLCFKAIKLDIPIEIRNNINWKHFTCKIGKDETSNLAIELVNEVEYVPINKTIINEKKGIALVGRLVPLTDKFKYHLLEYLNDSVYKTEFRQGASIIPRNLLFVDYEETSENNPHCTIYPSESIQSKKYSSWGFEAYISAKILPQYIFKIAKSTGLLPFYYYEPYHVFLPIEKEGNSFQIIEENLKDTISNDHYSLIKSLYRQNIKPGAKIKEITVRLDYGSALSNPLQYKNPKIVYAGIGSNVKAAIIYEQMIIDTSLYYYIPESVEEAYYLMGYLNSTVLTTHIKIIGSTGAGGSLRNIHKHPWDLNLPKYNKNNQNHRTLVELSKKIEKIVKIIIEKHNSYEKLTPKKLKNRILENYKYIKHMKELDELINTIFIL